MDRRLIGLASISPRVDQFDEFGIQIHMPGLTSNFAERGLVSLAVSVHASPCLRSARALDVETIPWASLTYVDFARVRAELGRLSVPLGNACLSVLRRTVGEARRLGMLDASLVDDVLALPGCAAPTARSG